MSIDRDGLLKAFPIGAMKVNGFDIGASLREIFAEQPELAALREELAEKQAFAEMFYQKQRLAETKQANAERKLTAAEQRNAVLIKALTDTREALGREYWDQYAGLDETRDILDATLKPTESGVSE